MNKKKSDAYRARARQCMEKAAEVSDPQVRGRLEDAAAHWLYIADQADLRVWVVAASTVGFDAAS
jgi:hypothetical protein